MYYSVTTTSRSFLSTSLNFKLSATGEGGPSFQSHAEECLDILRDDIKLSPVSVSNLKIPLTYDLEILPLGTRPTEMWDEGIDTRLWKGCSLHFQK